jgi:hypothetical protein
VDARHGAEQSTEGLPGLPGAIIALVRAAGCAGAPPAGAGSYLVTANASWMQIAGGR